MNEPRTSKPPRKITISTSKQAQEHSSIYGQNPEHKKTLPKTTTNRNRLKQQKSELTGHREIFLSGELKAESTKHVKETDMSTGESQVTLRR
jgi:hypothetical protein